MPQSISRAITFFISPIVSAALLVFSQSALIPLYVLPFCIFVPVIISVLRTTSFRGRLLIAAFFGVVTGLAALYGSQSYGYHLYLGAAAITASGYALTVLIAAGILRKQPTLFGACSAASLVVLLEYLLASIPWIMVARLAGTISLDVPLLQLVAYTGHLGASFVVFVGNALFAIAVLQWKQNRNSAYQMCGSAIGIVLLLYIFGSFAVEETQPSDRNQRFALIQGSIRSEIYERMPDDRRIWDLVVDQYFRMTKEAIALGYTQIIWPETAVRSYFGIATQLEKFFSRYDAAIFGGFPLLMQESGTQYNSVLWLNAEGAIESRYDKNFLLPFTENEFVAGAENNPITSSSGSYTTPICFEALFAPLVRHSVAKGGEAIVVFSNDAGFGRGVISAVMVRQSLLRAVENRRWLVRAAQSGISVVADANGRILDRTKLFEKRIMPVHITLRSDQTVYNRFGDWFLIVLVPLAVVGLRRNRED